MKALPHDVVEGRRFAFRLEAMSDRRIHILLGRNADGTATHLSASGQAHHAESEPKEWIVGMLVEHANGRRAAKSTRLEVIADARVALAKWLRRKGAPAMLAAAGKEARRREVAMAEHAVTEARVSLANARKRLAKATGEVARG